MSKPVVAVARKNSLREQTEETLRETRFERKPVLVWVTLDICGLCCQLKSIH